jgi:hypothetical protein
MGGSQRASENDPYRTKPLVGRYIYRYVGGQRWGTRWGTPVPYRSSTMGDALRALVTRRPPPVDPPLPPGVEEPELPLQGSPGGRFRLSVWLLAF